MRVREFVPSRMDERRADINQKYFPKKKLALLTAIAKSERGASPYMPYQITIVRSYLFIAAVGAVTLELATT